MVKLPYCIIPQQNSLPASAWMGKTLLNGNHKDSAEQDRPFLRSQTGRFSQ
jgi:hypothetical protein